MLVAGEGLGEDVTSSAGSPSRRRQGRKTKGGKSQETGEIRVRGRR
jgi:hypothetical protein